MLSYSVVYHSIVYHMIVYIIIFFSAAKTSRAVAPRPRARTSTYDRIRKLRPTSPDSGASHRHEGEP